MDSLTEANIKCYGCGATLQSQTENLPGYVPEKKLKNNEQKKLICKRCHRIKHYNEILQVTLDETKFINILRQVSKDSSAAILYVIDIFDFEGSWLSQVPEYLAEFPIYVVINKADVLPRDINAERIRLWVSDELVQKGLQVEKVFLVSALKRWDLDNLANAVLKHYVNKNIYVIGATNVGKSTLLNRLVPILIGQAEQVKMFDIPEITTSVYSGTTVETLKIPLSSEYAIYDTPGIIKHERLTEQICPKCLQAVIPAKRINPRIYQLNSKQTLFLGGLARFDYLEGDKQPFVCYVSNELNVHRTKLDNADDLYQTHNKDLLTPPCADCAQDFSLNKIIELDIPVYQEIDVVIAGLGWITLKGYKSKLRLYVPEAAEVRTRTALI
ncbi:ribosome biogenesis GTPase YqeH [Desulfuribacillus alkaliarsenatis]|uniref:Ribosome biogenesis GTPase YqeH n=1 Tax=Desulfuribacillus alkaliarsenatis TaxID=766136 RepID=A0A1E5G0E7_9FIRM|nr:ribosome biogenesis GTPase YqeH [Desulfuribacillus alkaliarsenatis]OEF96260.1 ribosome biogenesis GTPase YqeH [Desulfuribacillus alkaliarsenatis]